jgi:hypothetical protein
MADSYSFRIQELAISLVGAASNASMGAKVPFTGVVVPRLEQHLAMQHTDDTQVLLTQPSQGQGQGRWGAELEKEFAKKCILWGGYGAEKHYTAVLGTLSQLL